MRNLTSFAILFVLLLLTARVNAQTFSPSQLSSDGERSYQILLLALEFEDDEIGFAQDSSKLVNAYRVLLKERDADAAFKSLLDKATPAGQLYALCGVYYTDHDFFRTVVEKYAERTNFVKTHLGCCMFRPMRLADLVKSTAPNVLRLSSPKQSLAEWATSNPTLIKNGYVKDIFGGGYPSQFSRHYY
jgi:hypothetical protein